MRSGARWKITEKQLDMLVAEGKIQGYTVINPPKAQEKKKKGRAKYLNEKVTWNGIVFDSKKEYQRYRLLLILEKKGIIVRLERQVVYELKVEGKVVAKYIADHVYMDVASGTWVTEDVKSDVTRTLPTYRLKKKLMKAIYNIEIKEV